MIWIILSGALFLGYVSCGDQYTLELEPTADYVSNDPIEVYLGKMIVFRTTATFAEGQTTEGVVIELLPSVLTTVFALGDIKSYTKGSGLTTSGTAIDGSNFDSNVERHKGSEYSDTTLKQRFDTRAVFNIGQVVSSGAGTTDADNQIIIEFEAIYVSTGGNSDGTEYNLGVGEEYDGGNYIWISLFSVILKDNAGTETEDPTFDISTGANNNIGHMIPRTVTVTMYIPRSASELTFEAVAMNDSSVEGISIQYMHLKSVGEAYAFGTEKENIFTNGYDGCPVRSLTLDLGKPINKELKEDSPDSNAYALEVEITILVENVDLVGDVVTIGFGLDIDGTEVWVSDIDLTVTSGSQPPFITFTATGTNGQLVVSPGFPGAAEIVLTVPQQSNHNYDFQISSDDLSILALTPKTHGNNIPCSIPDLAINISFTETVPDSGINGQASLMVNISNTGMQPAPNSDSNLYKFDVYIMMPPTASQGQTLTLSVDVNNVGTQTVVFTAGPPGNYVDDANYNFTLQNDCTDNIHLTGSTMAFKMKVETQRSAVVGPMTIEVPIPTNTSQSHLKYKSATVISKGKNVPCLPYGELSAVLSDRVENSGENDKAVVTIPLMCNVEIVDDVMEDQFVIEVKVTMKDVPALLDADTTDQEEFGIGAKFGQKIWVASYGYNTKAPVDLSTAKRINGVIIADGDGPTIWPGDIKVQWSADNVEYHDYNYEFDAGTPGTGVTTYALDPPLYARYARLVNTDGGISTNYTFDSSVFQDITFHGSNASAEIMASRLMYLLDDDVKTCMSLPTLNTNDTAKYYWANFVSTAIGANGSAPFNLLLTGNGLLCNSPGGPQVSMVLIPKDSSTLKFRGKRMKCSVLEETAGPPMTCKYACACSDVITCANISLILYHKDHTGSAYELCDLKVVP